MADEKQSEWTITIDQFNGFVPSWYKNDWPSFGAKEQAADMLNIDLMDPNVMKPGPISKNLVNGDENGLVTTLTKSFMRQVVSDDVSYAIGGNLLYQISSMEVLGSDFPHLIDVTGAEGEDVVQFQEMILYFYNSAELKSGAGDIGLCDPSGVSFDDDWGSTVPTGADYIEYGPHQAIVAGDDTCYFTDGRYVGKITYDPDTTTFTLIKDALDFWADAQTASLTWNENRVKIAVNRPNTAGVNLNQSGIYNWNGYSSSWEGDPVEVNGRIGALFTKNGVDYVWWQDAGSEDEFNFGYISGMQLEILKKCLGTLPEFNQVGEYRGFIMWMSDGLIYLYGKSDPDAPVKFFQFTKAMYNTVSLDEEELGEELVSNGTFNSDLGSWDVYPGEDFTWDEVEGEGVVSAAGAALSSIVINGSFTDDADDWELSGGFSYGSNKVSTINGGSVAQAATPMQANVWYTWTFTVLDSPPTGELDTPFGTYDFAENSPGVIDGNSYFSGETALEFVSEVGSTMELDDIELYVKGGISQSIVLGEGNYKLTADITVVQGTLRIEGMDAGGYTELGNSYFTDESVEVIFYYAGGTFNLIFRDDGGFSEDRFIGTIDNVSLKEIMPTDFESGGIGVPFGDIMTGSSEDGTYYSIAKATDYAHNTSFWKTRAFPMMQPGYLSMIDKIQVSTEQISGDGSVATTMEYNQAASSQALSEIDASTGNGRFHKILNKSAKVEDFMLELAFTNQIEGTPEPVGIKSILIKGHYVPEN